MFSVRFNTEIAETQKLQSGREKQPAFLCVLTSCAICAFNFFYSCTF